MKSTKVDESIKIAKNLLLKHTCDVCSFCYLQDVTDNFCYYSELKPKANTCIHVWKL